MQTTGNIIALSKDWVTNKLLINLQVDDCPAEEVQALAQCEKLSVEIKKYRKKRSVDANGYYWKLLSKLAEVMGTSKPYMHNLMLRKYGQYEVVEGKEVVVFIPDTDEAEEKAMESETFHVKPTSKTEVRENGIRYRLYKMVKGSRDYDSYEMSKLIDGLVIECKENGIETLPQHELERMKAEWQKG